MTSAMAQTPQPGFLAAWVGAFTVFDEAHGFAVNLFTVVALAAIGAAFLTGQRRLVRPAVIAFTVLCLADWVLIEDFGFFGGLGTDPNSMLPFALLAVGGYLALAQAAGGPVRRHTGLPARTTSPAAGWRERIQPAAVRRSVATASIRSVAAVRRARPDHPRRRPDGRRPGQPERRPDPRRGHRRVDRAAELPGQGLPAHRPARPHGEPGQPARQRWCCSPSWTRSAPATAH